MAKLGTITAVEGTVGVKLADRGVAGGTVGVQISGTWVGTVAFEASMDNGAAYVAIAGAPVGASGVIGAVAATATGNDEWLFAVGGFSNFRVRCSAYTSGTINVAVQDSPGPAYAGGSVTPGTGAANLGKAEDAAHASGDVGVMLLGVQKATPANLAADGDYAPLQLSGGRLWVRQDARAYDVPTTITRPANITAYTANDVLGGAIDLGVLGPSAKPVMITGIQLEADITAIPAGMTTFNLYLYSVTPPSALADNAAFDIPAGDRASFLGKVSLGAPVDEGSTLYAEVNGVNKQLLLAGTNLFAYLVTVGAFTPAAVSEVYKLTVHTIEV